MRHLAGGLVFRGFIAGGLFVGSAWGQGSVGPTADQIVLRMMAKNAERQAALAHYEAERTYRLEYRGTGGAHSAEMLVDVDYTDEQKHMTIVSETGSKMICERVLRKLVESEQEASQRTNRMQMMLSPENYRIELVGQESMDGVRTWVLEVSPKVESKFTYRGRVWVSVDDYAMVRVLGEPAKNPSWWINHASFDWHYARRGQFWLPERNVAVSHVRIGGEATLTIDYGEYQVVATRTIKPEADTVSAGLRTARVGLIAGEASGERLRR
jgi:hypothetical protein